MKKAKNGMKLSHTKPSLPESVDSLFISKDKLDSRGI